MIHSVLMVGQSNMAGRGFLTEAAPIDTKGGRLKVLRNGRWQTIYRPINPDRSFSGTSLAESFVGAYADAHPDVDVGVIPCADGGTSLDQWKEGGLLFDNAVNCAKLALRTSHIVAIIWHQGEADCKDHLYPLYFDKITAIMKALRRELDADEIPLIVGGLGDFLPKRPGNPEFVNYDRVNEALEHFADVTPRTAFVSAKGLSANPDNLHFNHESLQEFGLRYYEAFAALEDKERIFCEKSGMDNAVRTEMELL